MRLLFLILAHDRPEQAAELALTLVGAATEGRVLIHYDARSPGTDLAALERAVAAEPRVRLVERRAACRWGSFGLVEAPLNALAQVEAEGPEADAPDYVILLSGACLPCRPVASLERYLAENSGREFIEVEDASWVGNGWREERWKYRFWFDHKTQHELEWLSFQVQRLLGRERRFPKGLAPRFGSQWWALTWDTCRAMLMDMARAPERLDFFRTVWIPDEMLFPTYVHALVHPEEIAGFGLTHFQFSNRGKPVVFHDDHLDYVGTLDAFFLRKASPGAARLRAACLARAKAPDDGGPGPSGSRRRGDYLVKMAAQTHYPVAGQVFYRDQHADMIAPVLKRATTPYLVLLGPPALTRALAASLPEPPVTVLGQAFAPDAVDLGPGRDGLGGLARDDVPIRDLHPALFLVRLRARCPGVPVLCWSPLDQGPLLSEVVQDPSALVVALLPYTGQEERDRQLLAWASLWPGAAHGPGVAPGVAPGPAPEAAPVPALLPARAPAEAWRSWLDARGEVEGWPDWLGRALFYPGHEAARLPQGATLALPWSLGREAAPLARRRLRDAALERCRFRHLPWFAALERAARAFWARELEAGPPALLAPPSEAAAAALGLILAEPAAAPATTAAAPAALAEEAS